MKKGMEKGREEGREQAMRELAVKLLDVLDVPTVAAKTGLSLAEVKALKQQP